MRTSRRPSVYIPALLLIAAFIPQSTLQAASNVWNPAASLAESRAGSAAVLLSDGQVLFTGGTGANGPLSTTETFKLDGSLAPGAPMRQARTHHVAVRLRDGRVLVAGGTVADGSVTNSAELYDPTSQTWTTVPDGMAASRTDHTASLLNDGRVLIAG